MPIKGLTICSNVLRGQSRRAADPSDEEKEEDLEMSKELVNVLIKEVYNKLLKSVGTEAVTDVGLRITSSL